MGSFNFSSGKISVWKSTGIFNYLANSNMNAAGDSRNNFPALKNDGRMYVYLSGNYFAQNKVIIPNNNNAINIYCVYELQPTVPSRDTTFTVQNALLGAMEITKNADTSKYKYKGYGICYDEGSTFSKCDVLLWAMLLCKGLVTRYYMQKKYIVKILLNQVKSLC